LLFLFFFKQKTAYEISACLVGSEMCIRDRGVTVGFLDWLKIGLPFTLLTTATSALFIWVVWR